MLTLDTFRSSPNVCTKFGALIWFYRIGAIELHRLNVEKKNVDGKKVEWGTRLSEEMSNSKKCRKDKTSNGK